MGKKKKVMYSVFFGVWLVGFWVVFPALPYLSNVFYQAVIPSSPQRSPYEWRNLEQNAILSICSILPNPLIQRIIMNPLVLQKIIELLLRYYLPQLFQKMVIEYLISHPDFLLGNPDLLNLILESFKVIEVKPQNITKFIDLGGLKIPAPFFTEPTQNTTNITIELSIPPTVFIKENLEINGWSNSSGAFIGCIAIFKGNNTHFYFFKGNAEFKIDIQIGEGYDVGYYQVFAYSVDSKYSGYSPLYTIKIMSKTIIRQFPSSFSALHLLFYWR